MGIEDIAPLISELLGIPFEAPDGVSPQEPFGCSGLNGEVPELLTAESPEGI